MNIKIYKTLILSVVISERHRFMLFKNRVPKRKFGPNRIKVHSHITIFSSGQQMHYSTLTQIEGDVHLR